MRFWSRYHKEKKLCFLEIPNFHAIFAELFVVETNEMRIYNSIYTLNSGKVSRIGDEIKIKLGCSENVMKTKFR